jgi:FkbM family methyltransferase
MSDQTYIDNIKAQVASGMYDHLFSDFTYKHAVTGKQDLVFLDIGANVGIVSIYAVPYCKRIVAVEPAPDTFEMLKRNTKDYPMIECVQVALTPKCEPHEFYVNDVNFTASSTVNTYGERITVEGVTLSGLLACHKLDHVDVCKCDIEGGEGESLSYEELQWATPRIKEWFIECHNDPKTSWEHKLGTIVGNLARCGYTRMAIDGMAITATRP